MLANRRNYLSGAKESEESLGKLPATPKGSIQYLKHKTFGPCFVQSKAAASTRQLYATMLPSSRSPCGTHKGVLNRPVVAFGPKLQC
jgi:hypothetical protein